MMPDSPTTEDVTRFLLHSIAHIARDDARHTSRSHYLAFVAARELLILAWYQVQDKRREAACVVCGSTNHVHCSTGCDSCDSPDNPSPVFAEGHCRKCGACLCDKCLSVHHCDTVRKNYE